MEIDFDGIANHGDLLCYAVSQHIEDAGVHSGDATHVLPAPDVDEATHDALITAARMIGKRLNVHGAYNIQFMLTTSRELLVIETNVRASRSLPFVSKTLGIDMIDIASNVLLGLPVSAIDCHPKRLPIKHYGVKAPMFSFKRLPGADPVLGVEMSSTGEVGCLGSDPYDAFLKSILATGGVVVNSSSTVMILAEHTKALAKFNSAGAKLAAHVGRILIVVNGGDAKQQPLHVQAATKWAKVMGMEEADALVRARDVTLAISLSSLHALENDGESVARGFAHLRRQVVDFAVPVILDVNIAMWYTEAIDRGTHTRMLYDTCLQQFHRPWKSPMVNDGGYDKSVLGRKKTATVAWY